MQKSTIEALDPYYEHERLAFLPIQAPLGWTAEQDKQEYIELWGESEDYRRDTQDLLETNLTKVHRVLEGWIQQFASKREGILDMPLSVMSIPEKVRMFTELLTSSKDRRYIVPISIKLARILWLDSERERLVRNPGAWLFPLYHLADSFLDAAAELEAALRWA